MAAAFLYRDRVAEAVFIGDVGVPAIASMPLSNIRDPQPRVRARWMPASASVYIDLGASVPISCVALIGTSLSSVASVRWRISDDAGFGVSDHDTGSLFALTTARINGNVVMIHPTSASGRYMRVDIDEPGAAYIDVGRIVAGPLWRTLRQVSYGAAEGRLILDRRDRNPHTGAEFAVPAVTNPRMATFTLPLVSDDEVVGEWRQMRDRLGGVGEALWIPDDGLPQHEMNERAIWGAAQRPGESLMVHANFAGHSRQFSIVERV